MKTSLLPVVVVLLVFALAVPLSGQNVRIESFQGKDVVSGEILVRFRGAGEAQSLTQAAQDTDIVYAEAVGRSGTVLLRSRSRSVTALLQAYGSRLDVVYAEPNQVWRATDFPNDALGGQLWGMRNTGQSIQTITGVAGADVKAWRAWDITEGSRAVVVGVVDSGVDYNHPDLAGNIWSAPTAFTVRINGQAITCAAGTHGFNAITRTCDPMDDFGHGTHVSGTIGAIGNNGVGVVGVSRIASIMGLKFLGSTGGGSTSDAIAAIDFALQVKALFPTEANIRVLNNSWGGGGYSQTLLDEINLLNTQDVLFVASAGNAGANNELTPTYPTNYTAPNIISVAATDNRDALASFSDWGPTSVDLGAPGVNVLSTLPSGLYGFNSGTSMAAPMVTGAAALVLSVCPLTTAALRANLMSTVDEIPALGERTLSGGRLNVYRAVTACAGAPPSTFTLTVSPGIQNIDLGSIATSVVTVAAVGDFMGSVGLNLSGLPSGMTATFSPTVISGGSGTSVLTIAVGTNAVAGTYPIEVSGMSGAFAEPERRAIVSVNAGPVVLPIAPGQTLFGTLSRSDRTSLEQSGSYADFYKLTLSSTTAVTIDMKSTLFNAYLYVLSPSGTILFSNDNTDGPNPRITATLDAGSYLIEATSADRLVGKYTLSINTPTLSTITPRLAPVGVATNVTLLGTRFISGMTIDAGSGITVRNLNVVSATQATAIITIAPDAVPGPRDLTVSTSEGVSNPRMYPVPVSIDPGQKISGSLSVTDLTWPSDPFFYEDLYQFTLNSTTQGQVTIDVKPTGGFLPFVSVFSSTGATLAVGTTRIVTTLPVGTYFVDITSQLLQSVGDYVLSVSLPGLTAIAPRFIEQGTSTPVTLTGSRFLAPMTIAAGSDISAGTVTVANPGIAAVTLTAAANAALGIREVTAATPAGSTNAVNLSIVPAIPTITLGSPVSGTLSATDPLSLDLPGATMDLYRFTLTASTRVTIALQSAEFDGLIVLLNAGGAITASNNDNGADRNSALTLTLAAGTYFIEATSLQDRQTGSYTLSLNPVSVAVTALIPRLGIPGATYTVSLNGTSFAAPMTVNAGSGISVSNVAIINPTLAIATFTIAADAALGARDVTVTTPAGTSSAIAFTVYSTSSISLGETKAGTLSITDKPAPNRPADYGDLYRLTLTAATSVAIDMKSTAFNAYLNVLSSTLGLVMFSDDQSGGANDARVTAILAAGTYFIEATSSTAGLGDYTLSVALNPIALNFPRDFTASDLSQTGFALVNPGPTAAPVTFTLYGESGAAIATSEQTVIARGQFSKLGRELFPGVTQPGWVQATSNTVGLQAFWMGGDFVNVMDGAEAAPEGTALFFPLITPRTELNIADLGKGINAVTIALYDGANGALLGLVGRPIPAGGVFKSTVAALFPAADLAASATFLRVSGSQRLTGTTVTMDYPLGPSMTVLNGIPDSVTATQVNFPHVVSGPQDGSASWTSIVGVIGILGSGQPVTVTFTPISGPAVSVTRTLSVRGVLRESLQSLFNFPTAMQEGWVRVTSPLPIGAYIAYGFSGAGGAAVVPGQSTARTSMLFAHVANGPGWGTGLALLNPSTTTAANVQVYIMRSTGALVGSSTFTLAPGTKRSMLLTELVPTSDANDGFVFVRTTNLVPLYGMELFFSRDQKVIANISPGVLDPSITYTPPTSTAP